MEVLSSLCDEGCVCATMMDEYPDRLAGQIMLRG